MCVQRLCIVTHTFLPHVGGIERVVYEQGKRLTEAGFDVTVLTSRMRTPENYVVSGIKVKCYDSLNAAFGLGIPYPIPEVNSFKPFFKCVKQSDLVHVHGHPYLSSFYASKLAKFCEKPVVLTQHNTFIEYSGSVWDHIEWLNDATIGKQVIKNSDRIITVSNATKNYVISLGAKSTKTTVIHNGVDVNRFRPSEPARSIVRKKFGIPNNAIVVLTVRRLVYKNGIDTLVDSARIALQQNPNLIFLVVGAGPDRQTVQARIQELGISDRFLLAGFVSDSDLPAYYNAADLFVLPSKSGEGLPLVTLEAMSSGLPVIATDVGGIKEVIVQGYGALIPADEPREMAQTILEFSRTDFSTIKATIHGIAEHTLSWEENVKRLVGIYKELI